LYVNSGIQIDDEAKVLAGPSAKAIPGLFACGEVAGGVHGANRLGGSSLLGCVVYGRVAGATAASYLLNTLSSETAARRIAGITGHIAPLSISFNGVKLDLSFDGAPVASAGAIQAVTEVPSAAPAAAASAPKVLREITTAEVAKHNKEDDCWVIVNGQVLNATPFLKGDEINFFI
jgi:succinate dehydrogenase/fumarate reductase flavoprotein subunit